MKNLWERLPGPPAAKGMLMAAMVIVALLVLFVIFEQAGDLLDSGGAIGS